MGAVPTNTCLSGTGSYPSNSRSHENQSVTPPITAAITKALDRREWPATEVEIRVARASLFTAQAIALDLIAAGREKEVQEIRDFISTIVPDIDNNPAAANRCGPQTHATNTGGQ